VTAAAAAVKQGEYCHRRPGQPNAAMTGMIFHDVPTLEEVLVSLERAERAINA
jgi:hypothetical protein